MLEEQKIYGSQFLTDCSPESLKDLSDNFSFFLKKLGLSLSDQLEWQNIFTDATNKVHSNKLITSWTLRGDQICLELFQASASPLKSIYHHENSLSPSSSRQIISRKYNNLHNYNQDQSTIYELEIASEFQKKILPIPSLPKNEHWSLFIKRKSSLHVTGDYVDAYQNKNGDLFLIIADVMGKGITAAFLAAMIHTAFDINLESNISLTELIHSLNHIIIRETKHLTIFATCAIAFIPFSCQYVEIINAAHCPPLLFNKTKLVHQCLPSGPPLGLFETARYTSETIPISNAEHLIMLTDGLYEWKYNHTLWGWENLIKFFSQHLSSPEHLWNALQNQISASASPNSLTDDQTLLFWTKKNEQHPSKHT